MALWRDEPLLSPWQLHPALTSDRLTKVANIIRRTRDSAARGAKWALGDDLLVIGLTAYKRALRQLGEAAIHEYTDWLSPVIVDGHHLIKIGMVPLRHYRGFEDEPVPDKYRVAEAAEQEAKELAFKGLKPIDGYFRLEVATKPKGFTESVSFVMIDKYGERQHPWTIPTFSESKRRTGVVKLPAAQARTAEDSEQTTDNRGS